ncbi:MAG TPA: YdeI/OmpD-associated family protein [Longimicrobiaceae bacterium]|nr:YdeI/OmpD-associated family protein [Longimicrobiaceae bacterium]
MNTEPTPPGDRPVVHLERPEDWEAWLERNHAASPGVWLRLGKKGSGLPSPSYDEALEAALCWGWIDGQKRRWDERSWIQKFTPRGPRSTWSRVNTEKVGRLVESGRMRPPGLLAVERAKADGRWDAAYDSPSRATVPDDLQAALDASPGAKAFFATLNGANRYAVLWRVQTARRPETRAKRIRELVGMLERGEKLHP